MLLVLLLGGLALVLVSSGSDEPSDAIESADPSTTEEMAEETPTSTDAATTVPETTEVSVPPTTTEVAAAVDDTVPVETSAPSTEAAAETTAAPVTTAPPPTAAPAPPPTAPPAAPAEPESEPFQRYQFGTSTTGSPIDAFRGGTIGGRTMIVVGGLFPESRRGEVIANDLVGLTPPPGVEMLVVPNPNPIGNGRVNPNGVNLNRNFPSTDWRFIEPGRDHSGPQPGSEVETQNLVSLFEQTDPELVVVLSDTNNGAVDFNPRVDRQDLPNAYAGLVGIGVSRVPCESCTGNLTTYVNDFFGDSFFVGVPESYDPATYARGLIQLAAQL